MGAQIEERCLASERIGLEISSETKREQQELCLSSPCRPVAAAPASEWRRQ
jgi:hypothetical protein